MARLYLGVDIGSISINTVLVDSERRVVENHYTWCHGRPFHRLEEILTEIVERRVGDELVLEALTGTGGELASRMLGGQFVNEVVAQSSAVIALYPQARSVIEMGGEDSKLIMIDRGPGGEIQLEDFAMNSMCAAGTGSFLDQQAKRMGISIEQEFGVVFFCRKVRCL